jgi:pilus assembly protein CpaE
MGTVIGIFSAKGGVGKTILATNLAVACGVGHRRKTGLIDLNPGLGTADLLLDLAPENSWGDLIPVIDELSAKHLKLAVSEYRPGVDLLASPPEMTWKGSLTKKNLALLLEVFREEYDLIVLDTSPGSGSVSSAALSLADVRLIMITPDAPSLRATSRYLADLSDKDKTTGLLINQQSSGSAITPDEIKEHLGVHLFGVFPIEAASVWANISYGDPCVLRKSSKLGKVIRQFTVRLLKMIDQKGN